MMSENKKSLKNEKLITHNNNNKEINKYLYIRKLTEKSDLTLPLDQELEILEQLSQFELGRFLLSNKGLDGYWTSYLIRHGLKQKTLHPLEEWILESAPAVRATRERFVVFQKILE